MDNCYINIINKKVREMEFVKTEKIELKRKYTDAIEKEIVAFLNTKGGVLYIGVEDDGSRSRKSRRNI